MEKKDKKGCFIITSHCRKCLLFKPVDELERVIENGEEIQVCKECRSKSK